MHFWQFYGMLQAWPKVQRILAPGDNNYDQFMMHAKADPELAELALRYAMSMPGTRTIAVDLIFNVGFREEGIANAINEYLHELADDQIKDSFRDALEKGNVAVLLGIVSNPVTAPHISEDDIKKLSAEINRVFSLAAVSLDTNKVLTLLEDPRFGNYISQDTIRAVARQLDTMLSASVDLEDSEHIMHMLSNPKIAHALSPEVAGKAFRYMCDLHISNDQLKRILEANSFLYGGVRFPHEAIDDALISAATRGEVEAVEIILEATHFPVSQQLSDVLNAEFRRRLSENPVNPCGLLDILGCPMVTLGITEETIDSAAPLLSEGIKQLAASNNIPRLVKILRNSKIPNRLFNEVFVAIARVKPGECVRMLDELKPRISNEAIREVAPIIEAGLRGIAAHTRNSAPGELVRALFNPNILSNISERIFDDVFDIILNNGNFFLAKGLVPSTTEEKGNFATMRSNAFNRAFLRLLTHGNFGAVSEILCNRPEANKLCQDISSETFAQIAPTLNEAFNHHLFDRLTDFRGLIEILDHPLIRDGITDETLRQATRGINQEFKSISQEVGSIHTLVRILENPRIGPLISDETIRQIAPGINEEIRRLTTPEAGSSLVYVLANPRIASSISYDTFIAVLPKLKELPGGRKLADQLMKSPHLTTMRSDAIKRAKNSELLRRLPQSKLWDT